MNNEEKDSFKQAVYDIVRTIPYGRATSYGAIAKAIGYPAFSRMVGHILAQCESHTNHLPAHRVVNSCGYLSGKAAFGPYGEMHKLLAAEGIVIENDRIKNWRKVFWDPLEEINI